MSLGIVTSTSPSIFSKTGKAIKGKVGLGSLVGLGITSLFLLPEVKRVGKVCAESTTNKAGNTLKQVGGSAVNYGKWFIIPAVVAAVVNPVSIVGIAACTAAGFILPEKIKEFDFTEEGNQPKS